MSYKHTNTFHHHHHQQTDKVLMDDLIEYEALTEDELPLQEHFERVRRGVENASEAIMSTTTMPMKEKECKRKHFGRHNRCCNDGFEKSEEMKEIKRQCFAEVKKQRKSRKSEGDNESLDVFSCEKVEKNKANVVCAMECIAKKQGTVSISYTYIVEFIFTLKTFSQLTDDGIPDVDKLKSLIKKQYKEDAWQLKVMDDFVDNCLAEVAAKMVMQRQNDTDAAIQKCNAGPSIMAHCLWRQIVLKCPSDFQDKSQQCQKIREKEQKKEDVN